MKRVVLGGAWTHTFHSLGECPNHLDHQHYMLLTVLNSPLTAIGLVQGLDLECAAICSDLILVHLHIIYPKTSVHLLDGTPSLKLNFLIYFTVLNNKFLTQLWFSFSWWWKSNWTHYPELYNILLVWMQIIGNQYYS